MGKKALRASINRFLELPGVTLKKRNVRTLSRAKQEHQIRNYASYIATFNAFASAPQDSLHLYPHQFGMMDMLGVKVEEKADCCAYTTEKCTGGAVVFEEKSPIFF